MRGPQGGSRADGALGGKGSALEGLFEVSLDMLCIADLKTMTLLKVNPAFSAALGYGEEELLGRSFLDFVHPDDVTRTLDVLGSKLRRGEPVVRFENRYRRKDGAYRLIEWVSHPDPERGVTFAVARDVTERKKANEELLSYRDRLDELVDRRTAELRAAVEAAGAATFRLDLRSGQLILDDRWYEMAGRSRGTFPKTRAAWEACLHPDDRERVVREIERALASEAAKMRTQYRLLRPDGTVRHVESRAAILRDEVGGAIAMTGLHLDVTRRVAAEEALRRREGFLRATIDNLPADFWATDSELRFTVQNERCRRSIGEMIGQPITEARVPEGLKRRWIEDNRRVLAGETIVQEFEFPVDGEARTYTSRISPLVADGAIVGTIGTSIDITDRKRTEETLRASEAYLRTLMHNLPIDFFALDQEMRYRMQSALSREAIGDVLGKRIEEIGVSEELRRQWIAEHQQVLRGETLHREYHIAVGGDARTFLTTVAPVRVEEEIIGTVGTSMDITERERMEEALRRARDDLESRVEERTSELRESEARFRTLFVQAPDAYYLTDRHGVLVDGNRAAEVLLGAPKAQWIDRSLCDLGLLAPEEVHRLRGLLARHALGRPTGPDEFLLKRPDGREVPIEIRTYPVPLEARTVVLSIARDVSERHQMIEALRESKQLAVHLIDTANAIVLELDPAARIMRFNRYAEGLTGYTRDEVLGRTWHTTFLPKETRPELSAVFQDVLQHAPSAAVHVNRIVCKNGEERTIEWRNTTLAGRDGQVSGVLSIGIDVTERARALEELRASEGRLLEMLEGTITAFAETVEARDPYTAGHQRRVTNLAIRIGERLGLAAERIEATRVAGLLHDIGKIAVPAEILTKPTDLTAVEWGLLKEHPSHAATILARIPFPWPVAEIVLQHHERMDGTGYPNGVPGDRIRMEARILAVADTVEAMASHRPYRAARGLDAALDAIRDGRGSAYDARVVDACIDVFTQGFSFDAG